MNPTLKWCNYQWVTTSLSVNRYQRCKINNCFSQQKRILADVPQGSILRLLLFNIIVNDIFLSLQKCEIASYANDSTMYSTYKNINKCYDHIELWLYYLINLVLYRLMVLNPDKCSFFMLFAVKDVLQTDLVSNNFTIRNSTTRKKKN